jgi:hypothetical protein
MAAPDVAPNGSEDEEPAFIEESEATNQNDNDYVKEEEEEEEEEGEGMLTDDYIDTNSVKVAAKAGEKRKQEQRRMIKEINCKVPDSESDEDARPKKKTKDSAVAKGSVAAKSLIPKDELTETNLKQDDGKRKAKEKKGWLLRDTVNAHRSEQNRSEQNQGPVKDSVIRANLDKPERYVIPTCSDVDTQPTDALLSGLDQQCDSKV